MTLKFPNGEELEVRIARVQLLEQLDIEVLKIFVARWCPVFLRNGAARWRSSQDGSDEQIFGAKQQVPHGDSGD